ncbi:large conductance mechanosensitive channel protein MscL [Actinotalea fermentans]|uniref:Large-conductance mechanosensitive channel n=1 Tax=Actinotalea fermentans TaxID=43671 RepID=A0A511YX95_9CELL|nr:large conductance mechanosensitive channel protein MscL [Actinotalea fermentans]KGM14680.1 mechanosensitive ion channel protein MscL [Actinotalea fermentans ATCC 43279 = JCM 9966 = DSM 3133]GEN79756.1 large-conductance mechanosensitive channel [Actinotalea fermentans]
MINGFKQFILRGNVVDLAVAVVIGAALGAVVTSIVENIITPLLAALGGVPDVSGLWTFTINEAVFSLGAVIAAIVNFLFIAAAVYFVIVMPMNKLAERRKKGVEPEPKAPAEDVLLLQEIRDLLAARRDV